MELAKSVKTKIKICIFMAAAISGVGSIIYALLADISAAFPNASMTAIQNLVSAMNLCTAVGALSGGVIVRKIGLKPIMLIGSALLLIGGLMPTVFHTSLPLMYVSVLLTGIGMGWFSPMLATCIITYFTGSEQNSMMGLYSGVSTLGNSLTTMLAGIICTKTDWVTVHYMGFLFAVSFVLISILIPKSEKKQQPQPEQQEKRNKSVALFTARSWPVNVIRMMLMVQYAAFSLTVSMLVVGEGLGSVAEAAMAITIAMIVSTVVSAVYGKIAPMLNLHAHTVGALAGTIGCLLIATSTNLIMVYAGAMCFGVLVAMSSASQGIYTGAVCDDPLQFALNVSLCSTFSTIGISICPTLINGLTSLWTTDSLRGAFYTATAVGAVTVAAAFLINAYLTKRMKKQQLAIAEE